MGVRVRRDIVHAQGDHADVAATEEEKKAVFSMLGKLYITSNSAAEKLRSVLELVNEALDLKAAADATSRNALAKLQAALAKAMGETKGASRPERKVSGNGEARSSSGSMTRMEVEDGPPGAEAGSGEATKIEPGTEESILEELLDDEDDET
jgi:condensin complex subunit 3